MRKLIISIFLLCIVSFQVNGSDFSPPSVPESAEKYFPSNTETFADGLREIIIQATKMLGPELAEAATVCISVIAVIILVSILRGANESVCAVVRLVSVLSIGAILIKPSNTLLNLGIQTVNELTDYGKLLAPVLTGALAVQGGVSTATVLYSGATVINTVLSSCISGFLVPAIYVYAVLSLAGNAVGESLLKNLQDFTKWLMTWGLKVVIYIFTGYMTITGIVSGATDASALKAAKLTISSTVPVVGKIISDASDSVLSGAAVIKNATGIYGLLVIASICVAPFVKVGVHYLLLKLTSTICGVFDNSPAVELVKNFASVMGVVLAMVGTAGLLIMISIVCYIKGIT